MKKTSLKTNLFLTIIIVLLTTGLFSFGSFSLLEITFDMTLVLRYGLVGLVLGIFFFILMHFKLYYGLIIFLIGYMLAFYLLLATYKDGVAGWGDLIGILSWMFVMGASIALSLAIEVIMMLVRKNKEKKTALKEQINETEKLQD